MTLATQILFYVIIIHIRAIRKTLIIKEVFPRITRIALIVITSEARCASIAAICKKANPFFHIFIELLRTSGYTLISRK